MMWSLPFLLGVPFLFVSLVQPSPVSEKALKRMAKDFGLDFFNFGNIISKHTDVQRRFQQSANSDVRKVELDQLVEEMINETYENFSERIEAIRKVMSNAEEVAVEHFQKYDVPAGPDGKVPEIKWPDKYVNARKINTPIPPSEDKAAEDQDPLVTIKVDLKKDSHFGTSINTNFSAVHVPTSIYDKRPDVLEGIEWTAKLDTYFITNYQNNPLLYWQYFCSYKGFFRQYPAMKWPNDNGDKYNPDLFDCRTRPWYIAASNTPKNIIILHDVSGSMTGLRREIAKHVVYTVLETLTDNDYVNVFNFSEETTPVVPCFRDGLVQANLENIREFKVGLDQDCTQGVANFTAAFNTAFDILERYRNVNGCESSNCNEAIMLITDGVPYKYEEIFNERNRDPNSYEPDTPQQRKVQTRVFTYLIGREVTQKGEVLWIACNNKGYYVHITTLGEVQEQVLRYLWIMSRPMVLEQEHNISWTPVYADIAEIVESDWLWDMKNQKRQKERSERYKTFVRKVYNETEGSGFYVESDGDGGSPAKKIAGKRVAEFLDYGMTNPNEETLRKKFALEERIEKRQPKNPADDTPRPRAQAVSVKKLEFQIAKHKETEANLHHWGPEREFRFMISVSLPVFDLRNTTVRRDKADKEEKIAIFLGVVGTDIPIKEIHKITSPFKLGVNGYAFAITENGYIVFHPDWRPLLIDILKPNYNTVDLTEVELIDLDPDSVIERNQDPDLLSMRKDMIDMEVGPSQTKSLKVKIAQDEFKRVTIRKQKYAFAKINQTQYTLGIAIPHGQYRFFGEIELRRDGQGIDVTHYFEGVNESRNWRVNPDWTYCEFIRGEHPDLITKEDLLIHFLRMIQNEKPSFAWKNTGQKDLVQSLVFDANVTESFTSNKQWKLNDSERQVAQSFGAVIAFIATRSGLTRWIDISPEDVGSSTDIPFVEDNAHATEELWYKRAVDRYEIEPDSYVISVPFDSGTRNDSTPLAIATRAVFVKKNGQNLRHAPVAVTGVQFAYEKFSERFVNASNKVCGASNVDCYLLDDNAFIIYTSIRFADTGRFFGEVDTDALEKLVEKGIYKKVKVVDYQAICYHLVSKTGFANILLTPLNHLKMIFNWFLAKLAWLALQANIHSLFYPDFSSVLAEVSANDEQDLDTENPNSFPFLELASINKTRLRPCHQEYTLFTFGPAYINEISGKDHSSGKDHNKDPKFERVIYKQDHLDCYNQGSNNGFIQVTNIPKTNLILVVIDAECNRQKTKTNIKGKEVEYNLDIEVLNATTEKEILAQICRTPYRPMYRKRPKSCFAYHEEESQLREDCGGSSSIIETSIPLILLSLLILY